MRYGLGDVFEHAHCTRRSRVTLLRPIVALPAQSGLTGRNWRSGK